MLLNAKLDLVLLQKNRETKVLKRIECIEELEFEIEKKYKERFLKADSKELKMKCIQGYLQSPALDSLLAKKYKDSKEAKYWKEVRVLDFSEGSLKTKEDKEEIATEDLVVKKKSKAKKKVLS